MNSPVLITGASQRLGLAMADNLLGQGHHVVVTYRTPRPSITMLKDRGATVLQADFSTEAAIDRAIDEIKAISNRARSYSNLR